MCFSRQTTGPGIGGPNGSSATFDRVKPRQMNSFDYVVQHGQSMSRNGVPFDSCQNEALIGSQVSLGNYAAVVWALGEESSTDESFNSAEQTLVANYLAGGGNLFVSGSEIAWDLDRDSGPTAFDRAFLNEQLRADLNGNLNDDAGTYQFASASGSIFAGNAGGTFDDGTGSTYDVDYPDVLVPVGIGVTPAISYVGGRGGAAAIQYDGSAGGGKLVFFGFPFETIESAAARDQYMSDILRFFGLLASPRLIAAEFDSASGNVTLVWTSVPGRSYQAQYKNDLPDAAWIALGGTVFATTDTASKVDNTNDNVSQRFYRVELVD